MKVPDRMPLVHEIPRPSIEERLEILQDLATEFNFASVADMWRGLASMPKDRRRALDLQAAWRGAL